MKYSRLATLSILFCVFALIAACAPPASPVNPTETVPPSPTPRPANTVAPTSTNIPGFEDWLVFNPQVVDIDVQDSSLILTLTRRALWFMEQRGVLVYQSVEGDFRITADIYTMKASDPTQSPGGDGTVQLGGLMARNGKGGAENYVFIVVGDDGDGLSVETKNTVDSLSKYEGPAWDAAEAQLRLCRFGETFNLYKRHIDANEAWVLAKSFDRPDLPGTLQVGVNIYTDSKPDLKVRYDHVQIEPISSPSECETE